MEYKNQSVEPKKQYRPFGLLAELTYHCPLHCPYCSNPIQLTHGGTELNTEEWQRVIVEASELGILHILFSGGEPLLRKDLPELVACAREVGMYTNLITSGLRFTRNRAQRLQEAGLDSVQISFQADKAELADAIAGVAAHNLKLEAAQIARELDLPLTINAVLHRENIGRIGEIIALAERLDAQRLELANTQFLGWAFANKEALLPTREQVEQAYTIAKEAQIRLQGKIEVVYVMPDYHGDYPKPCLHGWGQRFLTVNPLGEVLPCQTAGNIPTLHFDNIREHTLEWIWHESDAFQKFRGTDWMPEPCQSCPRKEIDFAGCRCQAYLLTGDAANTDPACILSPNREKLTAIVEQARQPQEIQFFPGANRATINNGTRVRYRKNPIVAR